MENVNVANMNMCIYFDLLQNKSHSYSSVSQTLIYEITKNRYVETLYFVIVYIYINYFILTQFTAIHTPTYHTKQEK